MGELKTHSSIYRNTKRMDLIVDMHSAEYILQGLHTLIAFREVCIMMIRHYDVQTNECHLEAILLLSILYFIDCTLMDIGNQLYRHMYETTDTIVWHKYLRHYRLLSINENKNQPTRFPSEYAKRIWQHNALRYTTTKKYTDENTFC